MLRVAEEFVMLPAIRFQLRSKAIVPCPAESRLNPELRTIELNARNGIKRYLPS